jgi:GPH family glycoside/pentoside/hexuronide:cation symporter
MHYKRLPDKRLPASMVHSYGLSHATFNIMMYLALNYYTFFLTDVALIAAGHLAVLMFITHIVDAASIPIGGAIIQKTQFRWGQYRSWLLFMPLVTFVFFTLTFTHIQSLKYWMKIVFLGTTYIISHVSLNFAFNAQLGLISVLSGHVEDRARLSARNIQYGYASQILFSLAVIPVLNYMRTSYGESQGFFYTVIMLASVQVLGYWNLFIRTREYDPYDPDKKIKSSYNLPWLEMLKQLVGNKQLMIIMISDTVRDVGLFGLVSLAVYYFKYVTGDDSWMQQYTFFVAVSTFTATLIGPYIIPRIGRKEICVYTAFAGVIGYVILRIYGASGPVTYMTIICCTNFIVGLASPVRQAMYIDTAEYGYYNTGKNANALIMSMFTMPVKIGVAIALTIIPFYLETVIGYTPNMEVTPKFVTDLMNLIAFMPATAYLIAGIIMIFYELTEDKIAFYMEENTRKRAEGEAGS